LFWPGRHFTPTGRGSGQSRGFQAKPGRNITIDDLSDDFVKKFKPKKHKIVIEAFLWPSSPGVPTALHKAVLDTQVSYVLCMFQHHLFGLEI
jgi:hypothetical protein